MTQQEQQEFTDSLEAALSWMRAIQESLKANDNTQGPRDALEARLRETEKIHQSEHEGRLKMDVALVAAENLLHSEDEELRNQTHVKLKDLKSLWDETCTYIIHCHSRIEWVWLHWSEYLKAYEEFELWLMKQQRSLDVGVELQLGVKEKLWQVDQQRVVVSDIHGQAALLERLLDEAATLHNRTQDPSVEQQVQERLQESYNDVRDRAEERLSLLQKVAEEHQTYQGCVQRFQSWLLSKTKELTELMEREAGAEDKLRALQALDDSVAGEEKTLQHIEGLAEAVRGNTSPAGAEVVVEEAEELRLGWQRLRQGLCEVEDGLRCSLDSHSQYVTRCQRLGEDISRLRTMLQGLDQELEEGRGAGDRSEEQMEGQWRKYTGVRNALAGEESQVELLKAQLKELFRFSEDSRHLSDDVLAVVKEHQSVKCRATRLCSESESGLRSVLQDPLLVYSQWSHMVAQVLEASAEVTEFSHIAMLVQNIECLLKDSAHLQERLSQLQVKSDLLDSLFGPERSDGLQDELTAAARNRELLHNQLQQRKSRLQGLISRTKDFGDAYEMIRSKLSILRDRLMTVDRLQPDILAKKSQFDQFRVILKDLEDTEAHIPALETLVSSSSNNRTQFERLSSDWKHLHQAVRVKVHESEESIAEHEGFHDSLLNMEKWLMIMKQKLESFKSPAGGWSIEGRRTEAQRALGEFPEKELQLQQMEVQGQVVLRRTSEEGQVHIIRDMKRLRESWLFLYNLSLNLDRLLNSSSDQTDSNRSSLKTELSVDVASKQGEADGAGPGVVTDSSGIQIVQLQDSIANVYGASASSVPGEEGGLGRVKGQGEGCLLLAGQGSEQLSPSRTDPDCGFVLAGEDSPACSLHRRAGQSVSVADRSSNRERQAGAGGDIAAGGNRATGGDIAAGGNRAAGGERLEGGYSNVLAGGGRGASFTSEVSMEAGEGLILAGLGQAAAGGGRGGTAEAGEETAVAAGGGGGGGRGAGGGAFMLFRRDQAMKSSTPPSQLTTAISGQSSTRRLEFEAWLSQQSELLSGILNTNTSTLSAKELQTRQDTLQTLRSGLSWGHENFQLLLQETRAAGREPSEDLHLEDLRYRWMLHKSKLKELGDIRARAGPKRLQAKREQQEVPAKVQKKPGLCHRVCRLALPLWLLLLALLLLSFLLPFMDEGSSCSVSNNFARSFNIMLRYDGPPPT